MHRPCCTHHKVFNHLRGRWRGWSRLCKPATTTTTTIATTTSSTAAEATTAAAEATTAAAEATAAAAEATTAAAEATRTTRDELLTEALTRRVLPGCEEVLSLCHLPPS
jgi:hypothetical protein